MKKTRLFGIAIAAILAFSPLTGLSPVTNFKGDNSVVTVSAASVRGGLYLVQRYGFTIQEKTPTSSYRATYRVGQYVSVSTSGAINGRCQGAAQIFIITGQLGFVHG